jgi:hypothetical protein
MNRVKGVLPHAAGIVSRGEGETKAKISRLRPATTRQERLNEEKLNSKG